MPNCKENLTPFQTFITIMALLGLADILAIIFMVIVWGGERMEIIDYFQVGTSSWLTEGEGWIVFVAFMIFIFFVGLVVFWLIYQSYKKHYCSNFEKELKNYPKKVKDLF